MTAQTAKLKKLVGTQANDYIFIDNHLGARELLWAAKTKDPKHTVACNYNKMGFDEILDLTGEEYFYVYKNTSESYLMPKEYTEAVWEKCAESNFGYGLTLKYEH